MPGLLIIGKGPLLPVQLETMIFVFVFFLIFIHSEIRVKISQVYLNSPFFFADPPPPPPFKFVISLKRLDVIQCSNVCEIMLTGASHGIVIYFEHASTK